MTAFETASLVIAALALLVSVIGIIVRLIVELINAKK